MVPTSKRLCASTVTTNMNSFVKSLLSVAALAAAIALPSANAQLLLSGDAYGQFVDPGLAHTTVSNGPVVSLFESGVPFRPKAPFFDTKTSIKYTGSTFSNVGDGDLIDLGLLKIVNGVTKIHTTASSAVFDLYLDLAGNDVPPFKLTSLLFTIDNTSNNGTKNIPDLFFVGHTEVASFTVGGREVTLDLQFTNPALSVGSGSSISEGSFALDGIYAYVHFSPVPEASTYALWASALLVGVAIVRRRRSGSVQVAA
jgi:hypothetical protein